VQRGIVTTDGLEDVSIPREKVVGYVLTRGALGLACSLHEALCRIAFDKNDNHVYLLCEDDATLAPDFLTAFAELRATVERHEPQWEVLHVGYNPSCTTIGSCGHAACVHAEASSGTSSCCIGIPDGLFGMYGIAMPPRGAKALLERLFPVSMQVDTELSRLYQHYRKVEGDTQTRVFSTEPAQGPRLQVFAPRNLSLKAALEGQNNGWRGPIVVAPASTAENTDIQVISDKNHQQQYPR